MGKAKAKTKAKVDFKQLLLSKGEYFALGAAGLFMFILLLSGLSTSSKDPEKIAKGLKASADQVATRIKSQDIPAEDAKNTEMPVWLLHKNTYPTVNVSSFPISGPQFDPTGKPDTKRDKPLVLPIMGDPQVNLVKIPFKAFDITTTDKNGETVVEIGVISEKSVSTKMDKEAHDKVTNAVKNRAKKAAPQPGAGGFGPGGPVGFGPGGPGGMGPGGMGPGGMGPGGRGGMYGGRFDNSGKRTETTVTYIPLERLDDEMAKGKIPAMTVIPLRGVIIHMEVPYKMQLEEIKRALRLASTAEAMIALDGNGKVIYENGSIYTGYEVERQVSVPGQDGQLEIETPWSPYPFEQNYQRYINSRKMADIPEDPSLTAFIRSDMNLVLPLPQLVSELGQYPALRQLPNINKTISKLREKNITPAQVSETLNRLKGGSDSNSVYQNQSGEDTGAAPLYGPGAFGPGGMRPGKPGPMPPGPGPGTTVPGKGGGKLEANDILDDIDYLLLRFIDVDIEKGKTYQYRIRLKMRNPNFNRPADVSNSIYAEKAVLYSPWTEINAPVFIPPEDHLYSIDVGSFRRSIEESYPGDSIRSQRERERYLPRDTQVMVEMCKWMMEVRPDTGKTREPVGAWVVADIPVGRGEYLGRKQFIKLPLWSSERQMFTLREMPTTSKTSSKEPQPKGWIMDFATPDILADFSGGRVFTKVGDRRIYEDSASELLIVSPDGRLTVLKSQIDEANQERTDIVSTWTKWVADVEKRGKDGGKQENDPNGLAPKPGNQ